MSVCTLARYHHLARFPICLILVFFQVLSAHAAESAQKRISCLLYVQRNRLIGSEELYICPQGVRINSTNKGWHTIFLPPEWQAVTVSESAKLYYKNKKGDYWSRLMGAAVDPRFVQRVQKLPSSDLVAGIKTTKYIVTAREANFTYLADAEHTVPQRPCAEICNRCGAPTIEKMPLRIVSKGNGILLETVKCTRSSILPSFFQVPERYKEVSSPEQIMIHGNQNLIKDLLE